jgi:hypothetical protein
VLANATIRDVEKELARLREEMAGPDGTPALRTSSATHIAWVPERWEAAARAVQAGLAERHPSRLVLLLPRPEDPRDELDADVTVVCFPNESLGREVCAEVITLRLNGPRAEAPASVVLPLLVSDLPVFLRWRGEPPFGERPFEELVGVVDRLVVDSGEWDDPPGGLRLLESHLDLVAVSDLAWARTAPWRVAVAALWPEVADARSVRVAGPEADAILLAGWLGSRLHRRVELERLPAAGVEAVEIDGRPVEPPGGARATPSDLLSGELDRYGRDPVYEGALRFVGSASAVLG